MQNRRIQGFLPRMRRLLYRGERESGLFAGVLLFLFILLLVNVVDILGRAASEIIGSAELALVNQTEERVNNVDLQLSRLRQLPKAKTAVSCGKWGYLCQILKNILLYGVVFYKIV